MTETLNPPASSRRLAVARAARNDDEPFAPPLLEAVDAAWEALAAPFPPDEVEKLPKQLVRGDQSPLELSGPGPG